MKRTLSLIVLAMVTAALAGCEASGRVGDPNTTDNTSKHTYEKSTVRDNGDRTTKTEVKTERTY